MMCGPYNLDHMCSLICPNIVQTVSVCARESMPMNDAYKMISCLA